MRGENRFCIYTESFGVRCRKSNDIGGAILESCHYLSGSARAAVKMKKLAKILDKAGFDKSRISFGGIASVESGKFTEYVRGIDPAAAG